MDAPARIGRFIPHRHASSYLALGALLGVGAPLGFLALERIRLARHRGWLTQTMSDGGWALAYMAVSTPLVFALFGRTLGRYEDEARGSAQKLQRLREEFAAMVAHDLRSPVQTILLHVEVLLRRARDGEARVPVATLQHMKRGAERLAEMIGDLLDSTRIEATRLALAPEPLSLVEAVRSLLDRIRPTLGQHPVEAVIEASPVLLYADAGRLDQILTNLLENAAKYSEPATPIIVRVRETPREAIVSVEDRGPGIAAEDVPRLFDRFYQTKRAREMKSGLGLGLYITKGLVEAHGGRIEVESTPGQGTKFSVWLPRPRDGTRSALERGER